MTRHVILVVVISTVFGLYVHSSGAQLAVQSPNANSISSVIRANLVPQASLADLPQLQIQNLLNSRISVTIDSDLETADGVYIRKSEAKYDFPANGSKTVGMYLSGKHRLSKAIDLANIKVSADGSSGSIEFAKICGAPMPVQRSTADMLGMNVHLERFTDAQDWRVLQMLKAAGISSIREDMGFGAPDSKGGYGNQLTTCDKNVLAAQAFGMESLGDFSYFPASFDKGVDKSALAYNWAVALAKHYKGQVFSWECGNETNSGWGAYGDAADTAVLTKAFARGVHAVDMDAKVGTMGVAEAETSFVKSMLENRVADDVNAVCIHPYGGTAESTIGQCLKIRKLSDSFRSNLEIWADELGFQYAPGGRIDSSTGQPVDDNGFSLEQQADYVARLFVLGKSYDISRIYLYDFYAATDPEDFWIVNTDFSPRPAYNALVNVASAIKSATSIGGTDYDELVQRHYFRKKNGSVLMIAWALKDGVSSNLHLPSGATAVDVLGNKVILASAGDQVLGNRPIIIDGLSPNDIPSFVDKEVIVSDFDQRTYFEPMNRWTVAVGQKIEIPCVIFNSSTKTVHAQPVVVRTCPEWQIAVPNDVDVNPGQTAVTYFNVTAPNDAVDGVEYHFDLAADIDGLRRSEVYTVRVKTTGDFPYSAIINSRPKLTYPMFDPFYETRSGTGQPNLTASFHNVSIDGDLDGWSAGEFHPIDQFVEGGLRDPEQPDTHDWSGRVALRWDNNYLYAAFVVLDDDLSLTDFTSRDWRDSDHVCLFLSTESDETKRADVMTDKDYRIYITPTGIGHTEHPMVFCASLGGFVHDGIEQQIRATSKVWSGGYVIEAAIPFSALKYKPQAGATLGLNVLAVDADGGHRQVEAMTYYKDGTYWISPKSLGVLTLNK